MKAIPRPEDVSAEYAELVKRQAALGAQATRIDADMRELQAAMGNEQATDRHAERVASLVSGLDYIAPPPIRERMAGLAAEKRAVTEALQALSAAIRAEVQRTSRQIVEQFQAERRELATEFYKHIAAAAKAHAQFGEMRRNFHRAGVDPAGFSDFGIELLGDAGHRNGPAGIALRKAARDGFLKESDVPEFAR